MYSPANVHVVFFYSDRDLPVAKTSLGGFCFVGFFFIVFCLIFSSVFFKIFRKINVEQLASEPNFFRQKKRSNKKEKSPAVQTSGWACRTRVQSFRGYLKNGVDI